MSSILENMAARLANPVSRQEGSFAMDNLQAVAVELERLEDMGINYLPNRFFPTLANGEDLTLAAENFGVQRKPAIPATVMLKIAGAPGTVVGNSIRAASGGIVFAVDQEQTIPQSGMVSVHATALEPGLQGNVPAGAVNEFVTTYPGLTGVSNPQAASGGADEESDADLLLRVKARWALPYMGGTQNDYIRWSLDVDGVSRARAFNPRAGIVEIYVVAAGNLEASEELLAAVKAEIEKQRPVGASVSVLSAEAVPINIEATVVLENGAQLSAVEAAIEAGLEEYLLAQAFFSSAISYARIAELLFVPGVADVTSYTLCGAAQSVTLGETQFGQKGSVSIHE